MSAPTQQPQQTGNLHTFPMHTYSHTLLILNTRDLRSQQLAWDQESIVTKVSGGEPPSMMTAANGNVQIRRRVDLIELSFIGLG